MPQPHGRDLDQTRERLAAWIARRLPEARDLTLSPLTGPAHTGFSNDTLLFDLAWTEAGRARREALVLRIAPSGFPVFPDYDIARQYRVMRALASTNVPVPRTLWLEEKPDLLGAPFYVMERVAGRIPSDNPPYHVSGWLTEAAPEEREALWWSGLETLARIHALPPAQLGLGFLTPPAAPATRAEALEAQLDYYARYLAWAARGRPQPVCEAALAWLQRERPRESEPPVLCWGDARIGNMIFREGCCVAVLDWEMATPGSPAQDVAWWLFVDRHHSEGCGTPRLRGFPTREESVARYEAWSGRRLEHLDYYEVFAGFRFGVIMIRVAQQLAAYGLLPENSAFETNNIVTHLLARTLGLPPP